MYGGYQVDSICESRLSELLDLTHSPHSMVRQYFAILYDSRIQLPPTSGLADFVRLYLEQYDPRACYPVSRLTMCSKATLFAPEMAYGMSFYSGQTSVWTTQRMGRRAIIVS